MEILKIPQLPTTFSYEELCTETVDYQNVNYDEFFNRFMYKNVPCILKNVSLTWKCTKDWIIDDMININYFIDKFGELEAPVADCNNVTYNSHNKAKMKVVDYMKYFSIKEKNQLLYLKDWHLKQLAPNERFYDIPMIFASDWLNEYAVDHNEDDFMFVYIGPTETWTPLHVDVYNSYSWSVNIIGRKKWVLFPPGEENKLKDQYGNLPLLFEPEKFENVKYIELIQEKGEGIFVPSGWHHQVINLLDTISINHNWVNGCNIKHVWQAINNSLNEVEHEISDLKNDPEYSSQCQVILKSLFGMNHLEFVNFLEYFAKKRLHQLESLNPISFGDFILGKNNILFDLKNILHIMHLICNHPLSIGNNSPINKNNLMNTINHISNMLDKHDVTYNFDMLIA